MASARKKQDEKHLKILRELVSRPENKECFDCHQRGPTYVNMTIGSFVCTSCSGMLRGLTPPHRVKSISMATFSPEEIELIRARGNEHCRQTWLGLYDANMSDTKDEQQVRAFMVAKYEKKRYYLEPSAACVYNGPSNFSPPPTQSQSRTSTPTPTSQASLPVVKPLSGLLGQAVKPLTFNMQAPSNPANMFTPDKSPTEFDANFSKSDPFNSSQLVSNTSQVSFADFENNPVFSQASMPTAATLANMSPFASPARKAASSIGVSGLQPVTSAGQPTVEDRYAALKDLDSQMKSQHSETQLSEWSAVSVKSDNVWTSSNFSPQISEQGVSADTIVINPFAITMVTDNRCPWTPATSTARAPGVSQGALDSFGANPFRAGVTNGHVTNGISSTLYHPTLVFPSSQSMTFAAKPWQAQLPGNPFKLDTSQSPSPATQSSNPFL